MSDGKKIGVAVYLNKWEFLDINKVTSHFQDRWPDIPIRFEGQNENVASLRIADSLLTVELRCSQVPQSVTDEALKATRHWPTADKELRSHKAHLAVAGNASPVTSVSLACGLTKLASTLLFTSDAIGLCWLNGPVLNPKPDFIAIASEVFTRGMLPCSLWIAAHWKPEARMIHTTGLDQFGCPEIFLAEQSAPTNVEYLFELVDHLLRSGNELLDGETVDGPKGVLKVEPIKGTVTGKRGVMLVPVKVN